MGILDALGLTTQRQIEQQQLEQSKQQIANYLQTAYGPQQAPYQLSPMETFGPEDPLAQMQQYNPMSLIQNLPGLMPQNQIDALAPILAQKPEMFAQMEMQRLAPKPQELTNDIQGYTQAMAMGLIPQGMGYLDYLGKVKQPLVKMGDNLPYKIPENYTLKDPTNPMAGVVPIPGSSADPNSPNYKFTDAELTAAGYANMMNAAETGIGAEYKGFSPINVVDALSDNIGAASNFAVSPEYQGYMQYANAWIRAKLRKESGATIQKDEWIKEYDTFFPKPGDTQKTIDQKAKLRGEAIKNMITMSQGAYEKNYPKQKKTPSRSIDDLVNKYAK